MIAAIVGDLGREGVERLVGEPGAVRVEGLLTGKHLTPLDATRAAVRLLHRRVEDPHRCRPDVRARPVTLDERNDRVVGHLEALIAHPNGLGHGLRAPWVLKFCRKGGGV